MTDVLPYAVHTPDDGASAPVGAAVWVGVDVGTQGVRVALLDERGTLVGGGTAPLQSRRGPGRRHEQDPEQWWSATVAALAQARAAVDVGAVRALAICSTSGTLLLADRDGEPLTPGVMYDDDRGAPHVARVAAEGAALWDELGLRMQGSWALPKLVGLFGGDATGAAARAGGTAARLPADARVLHSADFVAARLAGEPTATDASHALKSGYDSIRRRWPVELFERLGIPPQALPRVVAPGTPIGQLGAAAAAATGLPAGAAIVAGMTDGCGGQIAAGALAPGRVVSVLGTTLVLKGVSEQLLRDPHGAVYSHRSPDGEWLPGGASNVGAGALAAAFPGRDLPALDVAAAAHEPAGPLTYPLTARGERFPFYRPEAEGFTIGVAADDGDRFAALLQGVAYVERIGVAALAQLGAPLDGPLALTGGATRSRYWCQLRADVLGRPVELPRHPEAAVGMAVLAAAGADGGSLRDAAQRLLAPSARIEPRPDRAARFQERFGAFAQALVERGYLAPVLAAAAVAR
ncbi:FGGY-family carbohydrate kinase [Conexibacter sp. CPCC 206217]|uniref:FGGY-family carbohydrate kinase n=1 Tax=Conexibacter sp. CPCC 206217 TaxID=3064574 RepID=UPI002715848A|nr:FGGY family carbohydrate kinase [Conexibacter sp. CPCC 206217]MDO8213185.1 FGGY family carbohydrate kinase [Conexibacter sp. CPCC 206217]